MITFLHSERKRSIPLNSIKKGILFLVFLGIYAFYFCISTGMNTSNDGGHIGLAKAMYYDHQLNVEKYLDVYVKKPDYAVKEGVIYSDRLPGTALLIVPAFAYANLMDSLGITTFNTNDELDIVIASMLPPLFGMLSALLLFLYYYRILRKSFNLSLVCTIIYAFGTLALLESSHLFSHAPSLFFVSLSVLVVISNLKLKWQMQLLLVSGLLGFATLLELQNLLFFIPILFYLVHKHKLLKKEATNKAIFPLLMSAIILGSFIGVLLLYNYAAFDDLTLKSNKYNPFFPEERSFFSALSGNFLHGLDQLYTSFTNLSSYINPYEARLNQIPGLFVTSPVMILSVIGFFSYYKKYKSEALVLISCIIIATIIAALHVTTLVRHIYTINLFLFIPFIFFITSVTNRPKGTTRTFLLGIIALIVLISFLRVGFSTISYWGRNFDNLFLYSRELPLFLLVNLPFIILFILIIRYKRKGNLKSVTQ